MSEGGKLRLFFALWAPPAAAEALHAWASAAHALTGGRLTRDETIHLTLAFLGDVAGGRVAAVIDCARRVRAAAFEMTLERAQWWPHNGIVWAGPGTLPEPLRDLARALSTELAAAGFRTEKREFQAHVTLLRKAGPADALPALAPVAWPAEEFVLVRATLSESGPAYAVLARFALRAAG